MRSQDRLEIESGLVGVTCEVTGVWTAEGRMVLEGSIRLEMSVPRQDEHLPDQVEKAVEEAGQRLKRWAFQQFMERLDAELILAERGGKAGQGIVCRGRRSMTFKTIFGTVAIARRRVLHQADGTTEIPAARAWKTPQQVTITQGLRDATCDAMLRESSRKSLREIEHHAGESELLGRVTVLNLVHQVPGKTMVLCWYHLARRCFDDLGQACSGRKHRDAVCQEVLGHLWEGRVDEALAFLAQHRKDKEVRSRPAWDQFVEYVQNRRPYLPNYRERQQAGLWIASNRVEKLNDWAVSQQCKGNGMDWTPDGVLALAVLEATRRNGELPIWRRARALPAWPTKATETMAA